MCFAIPGKVVKVDGENIEVDYKSEKRTAKSLISVKEGEYVIVSVGFVIKKVPEKDALEAYKMLDELKIYN
ncbi:MAG: HypC/HybG/HupF family hydrogenase formation chaperone [archaeon]